MEDPCGRRNGGVTKGASSADFSLRDDAKATSLKSASSRWSQEYPDPDVRKPSTEPIPILLIRALVGKLLCR